jgi:hypothetical protein
MVSWPAIWGPVMKQYILVVGCGIATGTSKKGGGRDKVLVSPSRTCLHHLTSLH